MTEVKARRRRSEEELLDPGPSRIVTAVGGAVLGALGALVFATWEAAVVGRAGLALPAAGLAVEALVLYLVTGAVLGGIAGAFRFRGARWALATVLVAGAWLLCGKAGMVLAEAGATPWVAPFFLLPVGLLVGAIAAQLEAPESLHLGAATALFLLLALGLPLNQHVLGSPLAPVSLLVDLAVLIVAFLGAGVVVGLSGVVGQRGVVLPLVLGGVLGVLAAWPVLDRAPPDWPRSTTDAHPPVVLVVVDTLRADHLATYGHHRVTSPNLDRWARSGLVYEDVTATSSWTLPSVASILTGREAARHGAGVNLGRGNSRSPLRPDVETLPALLQEAGYATAGVVTNPWLTAAFGFDRGFGHYDDLVAVAALPVGLHPLQVLGLDPFGWPLYREAAAVTDQALSFVEAQEHRSWFLLVHYMDVHGPFVLEEQDVAAVGDAGQGALYDAYDASIHEVDRHLARLLEALPPGAWVFVTSDHGEQLLEKRDVGGDVPAGTRHGHTLYQEQLHVPLIVRGPGVGGRRVARPVATTDIFPTVLRLVDLEVPGRATGRPLVEVVGGTASTDRVLFADSVRFGAEQQAARRGRYKLLRWYQGPMRLYDLVEDPGELMPLSRSSDAEVTRLIHELEGALPPVGLADVAEPVPIGAEVQHLLERLGYLEADAEP